MKYLTLVAMALILSSCVSARQKEECKLTCLHTNMGYESVNDLGCVCKEKKNPDVDRYFKSN